MNRVRLLLVGEGISRIPIYWSHHISNIAYSLSNNDSTINFHIVNLGFYDFIDIRSLNHSTTAQRLLDTPEEPISNKLEYAKSLSRFYVNIVMNANFKIFFNII